MKFIKLFERFLQENYSAGEHPNFGMPSLYEMPSGLSKNKVYIIRLTLLCENGIYALVDYPQLEKIYKALNLNLISSKISWYTNKIYEKGRGRSAEQQDISNRYFLKVLTEEKEWNIEVVAESEREQFPYYVYFSGGQDSSTLIKKLEDLSKSCKVCGEDPSVTDTTPSGIKCSLGSEQFVTFDPNMEMGISNIVFPDSEGNPLDPDSTGERGYYMRFDSLSGFCFSASPGYDIGDRYWAKWPELDKKNSIIFNILSYKPDLVEVKERLKRESTARNFLDHIFAYLIDIEAPHYLISEISEILNKDDFEIQTLDYYYLDIDEFQKRILSFEPLKTSAYPDFKNATHRIALPGDKKLVDAILEKLPKNYKEIYLGLDSLDSKIIDKLIKKNGWGNSDAEEYKNKVLKYYIYLIGDKSPTLGKLKLYDEELPTDKEDFVKETQCRLDYGIYKSVTLEYINSLSPIELYLDMFFSK